MVTTRSSIKSTTASTVPASFDTKSSAASAKSIKKKPKDATDPRSADLLQVEQQEEQVATPLTRPVTGKRKRVSGAREAANVSSRRCVSSSPCGVPSFHTALADYVTNSKEILSIEDTQPSPEDAYRPTFQVDALNAFLQHVKDQAKCSECYKDLVKSCDLRSQIESRCPPPLDGSRFPYTNPVSAPSVLSAVHCPSNHCAAITCLGCGENINAGTKADQEQHCLYGCSRGWYVTLWMQLAYANLSRAPPSNEDEFADAQSRRSSAKSATSKQSKTSQRSKAPAGTGYASGNASVSEVDDAKSRAIAMTEEKAADRRDAILFGVLASLLRNKPANRSAEQPAEAPPPKKKAKSSRRVPTPTPQWPGYYPDDVILLPTMFHWSGILQNLATLFRNDSLDEAAARRDVYEAALDLTETLLDNNALASIVSGRTYDALKATETPPHTTFTAFPTFVKKLEEEGVLGSSSIEVDGPSVADSMDNVLMACDSLSNAATTMPRVYKDKSSRDLLHFATRFHDVGRRLGKTSTKPTIPSMVLPQASSSDSRFEMVEEADITKRYMRAKETGFKISSSSTHQRMRTLHKEVCMLRTSLPPGIWVKMASSRPDILKALIVGPEGTPYDGGLFEFDIFCPKDYPKLPPKVECATAARDDARQFSLNPNLYNTGYVCLSVINTWHGAKQEQWQPGKSTLLQVLISIQSMVLGTATPADNEPGGLGLSHEEYNRTVQPGTIKAALIPWIKAEELRKGIWRSEVEAYFKANANQILDIVRSWAKKNKRITQFQSYSYIPVPPPNAFIPPPPVPAATGNVDPQASAGSTVAPASSTAPSAPTIPAPIGGTSSLDDVPPMPSFGLALDEMGTMGDVSDIPAAGTPFPPELSPEDMQAEVENLMKRVREDRKTQPSVNLLTDLEKALKEFL